MSALPPIPTELMRHNEPSLSACHYRTSHSKFRNFNTSDGTSREAHYIDRR
jgi:hypothetical protein